MYSLPHLCGALSNLSLIQLSNQIFLDRYEATIDPQSGLVSVQITHDGLTGCVIIHSSHFEVDVWVVGKENEPAVVHKQCDSNELIGEQMFTAFNKAKLYIQPTTKLED